MAEATSPNRSGMNDVAYYFKLAAEQFSTINLFFYLDRCQYSHINGVCVGLKSRHFVVRVPLEEVEKRQIVWGSEVAGYFTVRDASIEPCHFNSRLVRLYNSPPKYLLLVFPLPASIDHNQRRFSRRVNISHETADGFGVWHGVMEGGDFDSLPALRWFALENRHCDLAEISANGMRLDFPEKSPICAKLAVNDPVLLRGDFGTPRKPLPIFVLGNIVRIMQKPDGEEGITSVGCHFGNWRRVDATQGQTWFRADPQEGIGAIAQWISRNFRNLNL